MKSVGVKIIKHAMTISQNVAIDKGSHYNIVANFGSICDIIAGSKPLKSGFILVRDVQEMEIR